MGNLQAGTAAEAATFRDTRRGYAWLRLLRIHHWLKNLLLGVPFLTAQAWSRPEACPRLVIGFLAFSLVASATYVMNDLADLAFDRAHAAKRHRPLAAGLIGERTALLAAIGLGLAGLAAAGLDGAAFLAVMFAYVALTTLYTRHLKRVALLDVLALGGLWTLRLFAGAAAIHVELSGWLLAFGACLFMSISLVKRCAELRAAPFDPHTRLPGRGYRRADLPALQALGIATGTIAILVLALFVDSSGALLHYAHPARLWLIWPGIGFWVARMWLVTARGGMHHDPIVWSLRDRASWVALAVVAAGWTAALVRL